MRRLFFSCMLLGLPLSAIGCSICASPYDYCSPVFTGECGEGCHPYVRAGSAFSGGPAPVYYDGAVVEGEGSENLEGEDAPMPSMDEPYGGSMVPGASYEY